MLISRRKRAKSTRPPVGGVGDGDGDGDGGAGADALLGCEAGGIVEGAGVTADLWGPCPLRPSAPSGRPAIASSSDLWNKPRRTNRQAIKGKAATSNPTAD